MNQLEKEQALLADVNTALENINSSFPESWTRNQVASVFQAYLEFYRPLK